MSEGLEALEMMNMTVDVMCSTEYNEAKKIVEQALKEYEQLKIIEQAQTHGFYFKDYQNNNEIRFSGNTFIRVGNQFVETKPCYEVKEITLYSYLEYSLPFLN